MLEAAFWWLHAESSLSLLRSRGADGRRGRESSCLTRQRPACLGVHTADSLCHAVRAFRFAFRLASRAPQ